MFDFILLLSFLFLGIAPSLASTCYDYSGYYSQDFYCENGCCGSSLHQYCCTDGSAVAGIVIGSLVGTAVLVAIIVVCIRYHTRRSVIISPVSAAAVTVVATHGMQQTMYPTQSYPPGTYAPNTYSNPAFAPPPYPNTPAPTITKGPLTTPQS